MLLKAFLLQNDYVMYEISIEEDFEWFSKPIANLRGKRVPPLDIVLLADTTCRRRHHLPTRTCSSPCRISQFCL